MALGFFGKQSDGRDMNDRKMTEAFERRYEDRNNQKPGIIELEN